MKTWMVTGGAGFIGGNFVLEAMAAGDVRIINLDLLTYAGNRDTLASIDADPRQHPTDSAFTWLLTTASNISMPACKTCRR